MLELGNAYPAHDLAASYFSLLARHQAEPFPYALARAASGNRSEHLLQWPQAQEKGHSFADRSI